MRPSLPKTKIVAAFGKRSPGRASGADASDATLEFAAESAVALKDPESQTGTSRARLTVAVLTVVLALALITAGVYWKDRWSPAASAAGGSLRIESDPAGAEVKLNGTSRGRTPLSLSVPSGDYKLTLQHGASVKELSVSVANGATTVHHVTWAETPPVETTETGTLSVATDPVGSEVVIDGVSRGVAPLTLRLPIGEHRVVVRARGTTYTRTVAIEAGANATLFIGGSQAPVPGSIAIASTIPVQVLQDGRLIGTSEMDRILMPAGEHVLELVAESVGFRATRTVRVVAGQTAAITVDLPRAPLNINAVPWAEVFIDGSRAGETPLANLPVALGDHEILFRHPQLGERRVNAVVTMKGANRLSVDMRQQ